MKTNKIANSTIITPSEAIKMGWTPGQLRVIANSLERISKREEPDMFEYQKNRFGDIEVACIHTTNFDPGLNYRNAARFRGLASAIEKFLRARSKREENLVEA